MVTWWFIKNPRLFIVGDSQFRFFLLLTSHHRTELVTVDQHAALVAVLFDAAGDHLDRHADLDGLLAQ